jgi:hypothetical protein
MRIYILLCLCFTVLLSCKNKTEQVAETPVNVEDITYASFGNKIMADNAVPALSMASQYKTMALGDSVSSKMVAKVDEVCQAKGCWMKLNLEEGNQVMVKFKDYGFFMPKDIAGKEVIVNGKAFVTEVPVEELQHYAEDAGKTPEEIAAITEPKKTFSFEADGVLLKQ